jgi:hypothetical protein
MSAIIPEVMQREIERKDNQNYNIHLSKTENNQTYNKIDNSNTDNSTTINNTQTKGFLRFVFDIITFPLVLVYRIIKYPFIRYEVKDNYNKYKQLYNKRKATEKALKKIEKMQGFNDEIF